MASFLPSCGCVWLLYPIILSRKLRVIPLAVGRYLVDLTAVSNMMVCAHCKHSKNAGMGLTHNWACDYCN
jgi:hypothetical protein